MKRPDASFHLGAQARQWLNQLMRDNRAPASATIRAVLFDRSIKPLSHEYESITIPIDGEDLARLDAECKRLGLTRSAYLRRKLLRRIGAQPIEQAVVAVDDVRRWLAELQRMLDEKGEYRQCSKIQRF